MLAVLSYVALSKSRVSFVHEDAAVGIRDLLPFLVPAMNLTFRGERVDSDCKTRWRGLRDKAGFRRLKVSAGLKRILRMRFIGRVNRNIAGSTILFKMAR